MRVTYRGGYWSIFRNAELELASKNFGFYAGNTGEGELFILWLDLPDHIDQSERRNKTHSISNRKQNKLNV